MPHTITDADRYRWLRASWLHNIEAGEDSEMQAAIEAVQTAAEMDVAIDAELLKPENEHLLGARAGGGNLQQRLRALVYGFHEWRVESPVDGSYCISFTRDESHDPERTARDWLADHAARFPQSKYASYIVKHHHVLTAKDAALAEAADALDALAAAPAVSAPSAGPSVDLRKIAEQAGISMDLWDMGAASLAYTEGCHGVARAELEKFAALYGFACWNAALEANPPNLQGFVSSAIGSLFEATRKPLSVKEIGSISIAAQIAYNLDKFDSYEEAIARGIEAAHRITADFQAPATAEGSDA